MGTPLGEQNLSSLLLAVYFTVEGSFLVASLAKFTHGSWLGGLLLTMMVAWIQGQRIRNDLTEFVPLADYLPMLQELSNDESAPKFATHVVYLTKSVGSKQPENGIAHSIFKKRPKRADVYYLVHVETTDDPYTRSYHVTHVLP